MKLPATPGQDDLRFLTEMLNTREAEIETLNDENKKLRRKLKKLKINGS